MKVVFKKSDENLDTSKKIYTCKTCEVLFNWGDSSSWYGSFKQQENKPHSIPYFCSKKCFEVFKQDHL